MENNNNNINQFFRYIYNNKFIKTRIFSFLKHSDKTSLKYDDICDLRDIIAHRYWSLLRDKIKRNEYLYLNRNSCELIFKIKDLDLFIKVFQRFKDYFPTLPPKIQYAALYDNIDVLKYLLNDSQHFIDIFKAFQWSFENKNYQMVHYLIDFLEQDKRMVSVLNRFGSPLISKVILLSISSKDIETLKRIFNFQAPKGVSDINIDEQEMFKKAYSTGDLQAFKLVHQKYSNNYNSILKTILNPHIRLCLGNNIKYRKDTYKKMTLQYDLLEYLLDQNLVRPDVYQDLKNCLVFQAFKLQDMDLYNKLMNQSNTKAICFNELSLSMITGSLSSLDKVKELIGLGVTITTTCITNSISSLNKNKKDGWEIFLYLVENHKMDYDIRALISMACKTANIKVLKFALDQKVEIKPQPWWVGDLKFSDENREFFQLLFENFRFESYILFGATEKSIQEGSIENFKTLLSMIQKNNNQSEFNRLYYRAASQGKIEFLEILIQNRVPHDHIVLCRASSVEIVNLLYHSGLAKSNPNVSYNNPEPLSIEVLQHLASLELPDKDDLMLCLLRNLIENHRIYSFQLLLSHCDFENNIDMVQNILICLATNNNLEMIQIFLDYQLNTTSTNYVPCFNVAMSNNNLELVEFLVDIFSIDYLVRKEDTRDFLQRLQDTKPFINNYFQSIFLDPQNQQFLESRPDLLKMFSSQPTNDIVDVDLYFKYLESNYPTKQST
ncbi:hypothetical protein CYY_007078 [Polysphondylium violaceum]|uniref:Ankyrin repeat-containing protein n=1 Tax=Polysphondylium violaceum TaxID=133409 RepID=A0A8J4PP59_9MYCE|nr:hypothetical protein CYY_007078 [Polysphondylium violaceum]